MIIWLTCFILAIATHACLIINTDDSYISGHFLPEEDDKYLERVKAAVEEEERQAATAARTDAAKDAILTAEESWKAAHHTTAQEDGLGQPKSGSTPEQNQGDASISERSDHASQKTEHDGQKVEIKGPAHSESLTNLPFEFYHYYHGSSYDLGTLIEVIYSKLSTSCKCQGFVGRC